MHSQHWLFHPCIKKQEKESENFAEQILENICTNIISFEAGLKQMI